MKKQTLKTVIITDRENLIKLVRLLDDSIGNCKPYDTRLDAELWQKIFERVNQLLEIEEKHNRKIFLERKVKQNE